PRKQEHDNKYSAGSVLIVGGAPGLTGAACLAAEAAFRADAGYVAVAVPEASLPIVETKLLEPVKLTWASVFEAAEKAGAVAVGPGLGRTAEAKRLVERILAELEQPVVIDADALHELAPGDWRAPVVLTPHAGELGRLIGESSDWVSAHRLEAARRTAERFDCVCLLKGADTIVTAPGARTLVCPIEAPALATAGTGDVLTGVLTAFLAKGLEPRLAAAAAATAHGLAGRTLPERGAVASDLIVALPLIL
ncbi:MAG: NAD(P)H-hydrate dehydratase, partial [Gaiellaceae bacterium]